MFEELFRQYYEVGQLQPAFNHKIAKNVAIAWFLDKKPQCSVDSSLSSNPLVVKISGLEINVG